MRTFRYLFLIALLASILPNNDVRAGTTGKIAGRVVDAKSKEPLPGVNVLVV